MATASQSSAPQSSARQSAQVTVYGAYGHTGRFVVRELQDRGFVPVLSGRDAVQLDELAAATRLESRPASVDDAAALDRALAGSAAVINCAGPFASTAGPLIESALRTGVPYVDVAAEIEANVDTFANFAGRADAAGAVVVPAMAFFGGLGDLLATVAMGDWSSADLVQVGYGLSSWRPTAGTRIAGAVSRERRGGQFVRFADGRLHYVDEHDTSIIDWPFPEPTGTKPLVVEFTMADIVTLPSHLDVREVRTSMAQAAANDMASSDTPEPTAADASGRSDQTFAVDVIVQRGDEQRRAVAHGRDIYAVTAPLAVEAVARIVDGRVTGSGVSSAGSAFDAADFLDALAPHITWEHLGAVAEPLAVVRSVATR
ncbi:saccharopine dehydrogenase NADP-binding domain-containing protein [Agromyces sp. NPDC058110]|uniref:saccharopine dehydrogenase NADP-binding domain-containing protein n=1 Tax=Agromyces sp. NPDC058110 TaxID=3346345 RepID=UPI0036DA963E